MLMMYRWRFICLICSKSYTSRYNIRMHRNMHTGKNVHRCRFCFRHFAHKHVYESHVRTHTGERPFVSIFNSITYLLQWRVAYLKARIFFLPPSGLSQMREIICGQEQLHFAWEEMQSFLWINNSSSLRHNSIGDAAASSPGPSSQHPKHHHTQPGGRRVSCYRYGHWWNQILLNMLVTTYGNCWHCPWF